MRATSLTAVSLLTAGVAHATDYDIGDVATVTFLAGDTLTNTGGITDWDNTTLVINEGSDLSNVDFTALGLTSWTTSFTTDTVTTWDGANLSGLALTLTGNNNFFNDSFDGTNFSGATITAPGNQPFVSASGTLDLTNVNFSGTTFNTTGGNTLGFAGYGTTIMAGADFSNSIWIDTGGSNNRVFEDGPGSTSTADKDLAADFSGADFSGLTEASAMDNIIDNLGLFDGGTPIGAIYDANTVLPAGYTTAQLDSAGWQNADAGPAPDPNYWTGTAGATWDQATTVNFTTNNEADPLVQDTFDNATAVSERATFADEYFSSSVGTAVTQNSITIAAGGVMTGNVDFSANSVVYDVASSDTNGIAGSTGINVTGTSAVTLTGDHATSGFTSIAAGSTLNLGDGITDASLTDSAIGVNGALVYNVLGSETLNGALSGSGTIEKLGAGTVTVTSASNHTGATTVTAGTLTFELDPGSTSFDIASGATLELSPEANVNAGNMTFSGAGTLLKTGSAGSIWSPGSGVFALDSGALIDVQEGIFRGGNNNNEDWTNNLADLHVEEFAEFEGWEANVRVDALTGGGIVMTGHVQPDTSYESFTIGVDNGSGTFDGIIEDNNSTRFGNLVKEGTGTQTLNGDNTYTGTTTVEAGALILNGNNGSVRDTTVVAGNLTVDIDGSVNFAPGANGVTNSIAGTVGTGTVNMNGGIFIDLSNAALQNGNTWTLVDPSNLTSVSYDPTDFYIDSTLGFFIWTDPGEWESDEPDPNWTFNESTGVLSYVGPDGYDAWLTNYPGLTDTSIDGDEEFDGLVNLLEYVFDGDPSVSDRDNPNLPTSDASGANYVFTFTRRVQSTADTTQTFQYGSDLTGWADIAVNTDAEPEVAIAAPVGDVETVTVTVAKSTFPDPDNGFGRLDVTLP
ncbi:beta strand repeat-containing protein [Haloferula sp.]|uniref:beta strand repeat-containing protein n=1 Tax=Haloferula sp. TaxID=2497595 RepID=UPI00329CE56F